MSDAFDLLKSFAVSSRPTTAPVEPVEIYTGPNGEKGWQDIKIRERAKFHNKPVETWSKRDVFYYIAFCYKEAFGKLMTESKGGKVDWMIRYALLSDVANMLRHQLKVEDISRQTEKDYYEFVFKNLVPTRAVNSKFTLWWLKDESWVAKFVQSRKREANIVTVVTEDVKLSWEKLDKAFLMGRAYFVINYGPALVANYLHLRKKKNLAQIALYFKEAALKYKSVSSNAVGEIIDNLKKYGPYPKWLPILNVDDLNIGVVVEVCEENALLGFMKES